MQSVYENSINQTTWYQSCQNVYAHVLSVTPHMSSPYHNRCSSLHVHTHGNDVHTPKCTHTNIIHTPTQSLLVFFPTNLTRTPVSGCCCTPHRWQLHIHIRHHKPQHQHTRNHHTPNQGQQRQHPHTQSSPCCHCESKCEDDNGDVACKGLSKGLGEVETQGGGLKVLQFCVGDVNMYVHHVCA